MKKTQTTKRALLSSVLALILCMSMFVGTTFAWFTDNVTSAGNKIVAGNLKVDLELLDAQSGKWNSLKETNAPIFNYDNWEPGYTDVKMLKVENEGSLALKWKAMFVSDAELSALADVIDVYVLAYGVLDDTAAAVVKYPAGRDLAGYTRVGTVKEFVNTIETTTVGTLKAGECAYLGIALKMQESAGNAYQGLDLGEFDIRIVAAQLESETDSFDATYDKNAMYPGEVSTAEELANAIAAGGNVKLLADIDTAESIVVPAGVTVNLDLNGKTIVGTDGRDDNNNRIHTIVNNGNLTVNGGTVKSAGNDGGSALLNESGANLTLNNVEVYGAPQSDPVYEAGVSKPYPSYAINNYGSLVVNGAIVKSYHGAIATGGNGVTVINDADIDVGLGQSTGITSYAIYSFEDAQVTVNGGKFAFTKQEIYVNGGNTFCELGTNPIIVNGGTFIGTSFSTGTGREYVLKGGTFDKDPTAYAKGTVVDNGNGTWTVKPYQVATSADLINAIANGGNVDLTSDVAINAKLSITADTVINGNGKTIKFTSGSSDRFIDVPKESNGANLTLKNVVIDIDGSYCQRGINYNTNGTLTLDNVTLTGATKATYGINLPSGSANATVEMTNCDITALIALNVWGEKVVVNVKDCNLSNYDDNATEGENYATVKLNNDGTNSAEGAVITITGGTITAKDETGADFVAINNNTATGTIVVSDTTVVEGITMVNKAVVRYRDGNGNFYNEFYGVSSLQGAVTLAAKSANAEVFLLTDITVDTLDVPANVTVHKNGYELTISTTTGSGNLNIVD